MIRYLYRAMPITREIQALKEIDFGSFDSSFDQESSPPRHIEYQDISFHSFDSDSPASSPVKRVASPRNHKTKLPRRLPLKRSLSTSNYHSIQLSTQKPAQLTGDLRGNLVGEPTSELVKSVKPLILSREQEHVLQLVMKGHSLFYTGSAGTGKSILLKSIIKALKGKYKPGQVAVTASTGLAACNIGGNTLHSFAGVGLGHGDPQVLLKKVRKNKKAVQRWHDAKVLIIDEVSMIEGQFLDKLNHIGKKLKRSTKPFGGVQIVACGDFFQLPPVVRKTAPDGSEIASPEEPMFAFESESWREGIARTIVLQEVFRQRGDQRFVDMLNEMRDGNVSDDTTHEFHRLARPLECAAGIVPAELFATRKEVDHSNNTKLSRLPGDAHAYTALDSGPLENPQRQNLLSNFLAPGHLYLKKHAQVMCIKNFDDTLVNGSLGQVVDFIDRDTYMRARNKDENNNDENDEKEKENVDESRLADSDFIFSFKTENTDNIENIPERENLKRKKSLMTAFEENSHARLYPLVRFLLPDGVNTRTILVEPEQWTVEDEHQKVVLSRVQLPIILAWSLSIHKSQGQTLPKVKVDLRNVFENGQSYVALSRAVSRNGLQVLNFDKHRVRAHAKVVDFYKTLSVADERPRESKGPRQSLVD